MRYTLDRVISNYYLEQYFLGASIGRDLGLVRLAPT